MLIDDSGHLISPRCVAAILSHDQHLLCDLSNEPLLYARFVYLMLICLPVLLVFDGGMPAVSLSYLLGQLI
jgi:hypothetical protein